MDWRAILLFSWFSLMCANAFAGDLGPHKLTPVLIQKVTAASEYGTKMDQYNLTTFDGCGCVSVACHDASFHHSPWRHSRPASRGIEPPAASYNRGDDRSRFAGLQPALLLATGFSRWYRVHPVVPREPASAGLLDQRIHPNPATQLQPRPSNQNY